MSKIMKGIMIAVATIFAMVTEASASLSTDIDNFTTIIGNTSYGLTGFLYNMMAVFLQPPLLYFVTLGIFVTIISIVAGLLMRRGRRR